VGCLVQAPTLENWKNSSSHFRKLEKVTDARLWRDAQGLDGGVRQKLAAEMTRTMSATLQHWEPTA
jgi:hypothetical protein